MVEDKQIQAAPADHGKTLAGWTFPDVPPHQRGRRWYIMAGILGALMALYGLWTANFLFPALLCLFALTFFLVRRKTTDIACTITEDGIGVGAVFYPYRELKQFSIIYQPPEVKNLYLEFKSALKSRLPIPLVDQNPVAIRHLLLDYLNEDLHRDDEPVLDQISRILKL